MQKDFILCSKLNRILVNAGDFGFKRRVKETIKGLNLKKKETILDCGCGDGFYMVVIQNLYPEIKIIGIDNDGEILNKAGKYVKKNALASIIKGDIYKLPFKKNYFDKIILSEVLEHLDNDFAGLREVYRVLKPGGLLAITVPNHNYPFWWDPLNRTRERLGFGHFNKDNELLAGLWSMHRRLYYPSEIMDLVKKAGFKIEKVKLLTHYCFPFSQIILHLGKRFLMQMHDSNTVSDSMEKFNWQRAKQGKFSFLRLGQKVLEKIDMLNENQEFALNASSHGIFLVCVKN